MNINFSNVYYDYTSDSPFAVFKDKVGKKFYIKINHHTANDILNYTNKNNVNIYSSFYNIFIDFFNSSNMTISNLNINKSYNGSYSGFLEIRKDENNFCYYLNGDDIILFSVIFNTTITISQNLFYDFDNTVQQNITYINVMDSQIEN